MKHAVSVSIGSSKRDKAVEVELFDEKIKLERIGTDGDMEKAARLYRELDGKVDALGVGGAILGIMVDRRWYPFHSVLSLIKDVKKTPVVDGTGLKMTLEKRVAGVTDQILEDNHGEKRVLITAALDRWGTARSFFDAGYSCAMCDLMFALGLPLPIRSIATIKIVASILLPVLTRMPFRWLYPVGEQQEKRTPKWHNYFRWATVISGDCHYVTRYMPDDMKDKIVVTNTTTISDRELFRRSGVRHLITTTPVMEERTFGTNMIEAALVAISGRKSRVDYANPGSYFNEMEDLIKQFNLTPQIQEL